MGIAVPADWTEIEHAGPRPFVTRRVFRRPDGVVVRWESRRHRKRGAGSTWWAPRAAGWWIGVLFAIGSFCFVLGSVPSYATAVGPRADGITYFVGSIFFTTASLLQYLQAANAAREVGLDLSHRRRWRRVLTWEPQRIDWWACAIQLVGTLFFNVTTFNAIHVGSSVSAANAHVWRPDALGSICFLVSSALAWGEVGHAWWSWRPRSIEWQIAALNMAGSIAFGVSAVAAKYVGPDTVRNASVDDLGTLVGALCFLVGAVLLLPERTMAEPGGSHADGFVTA